MSDAIRVGVNGAGGRMGRRIVALTHADPALEVAAAVDAEASGLVGQDIGELAGIGTSASPLKPPSRKTSTWYRLLAPRGTGSHRQHLHERSIALVAATPGAEPTSDPVDSVAKVAGLIVAPNMSLAVNLVMKLAADAARALSSSPGGVDVEIVERHPRVQGRQPEWNSVKFGELIAAERGQTSHVHGRRAESASGRRTRSATTP
ncbi:MAG: hypothetical protein CM1200mP2_21800 [Planctomycetaceae bacterium]|nr:MAG: hypothetical protein CM1200mP2_21800 [Planctomycetaceae bacterium]